MRGVYALTVQSPTERPRFIPTCVGFTWDSRNETPVYYGSSPHAWGLLTGNPREEVQKRFIPTCVGFTQIANQLVGSGAVHPHMRGVYTKERLEFW